MVSFHFCSFLSAKFSLNVRRCKERVLLHSIRANLFKDVHLGTSSIIYLAAISDNEIRCSSASSSSNDAGHKSVLAFFHFQPGCPTPHKQQVRMTTEEVEDLSSSRRTAQSSLLPAGRQRLPSLQLAPPSPSVHSLANLL